MVQVVVAVPARDEEDRLTGCLEAIDTQAGTRADAVVLVLNNCTDRSAGIVRKLRSRLATALHLVEVTLPPELAHAGGARRLAMDEAARLAGPSGVVLTTDADGRVDPDWVAANLAALGAGADAVAGRAELDPAEWDEAPARLREDGVREWFYNAACDELQGLLDPDPFDPLPRHNQEPGASLAVTVAAYRAVGGLPEVAHGEDRALMGALRRIDARIRHAPECRVVVSGRTVGRAPGGMADTMRRRLAASDRFLDERLEPALDCARRAAIRHAARNSFRGEDDGTWLRTLPGLDADMVGELGRCRWFGTGWERIEAASPGLVRRRVATGDVGEQQAIADALLRQARNDAVGCRARLLGAGWGA